MPDKKPPYPIRLLHGDIPLAVTFWVYLVLLNSISWTLLWTLVHTPVRIRWWWLLTLGICSIIHIYFTLATWRSAKKYQGAKHWKVAGKISAGLGWILLLLIILVRTMHVGLAGLQN